MANDSYKATEKQFLLKDYLFNEEKVKKLAKEIVSVYPEFPKGKFVRELVVRFPELELMERIGAIREVLYKYLPADYEQAVAIILKALPPALDNSKSDDDFGEFIYAPYSYYVAEYGCTKAHLQTSLKALEEITKCFSGEAALRSFINAFPAETLKVVEGWAKSPEYHVRRLASEGTRPNLPWAKKINYDTKAILPIIHLLHKDKTRYVTRSVANHLNDVSKFAKAEVFALLEKWQNEKVQNESELAFIAKHSLRTLIKEGDKKALSLLGYHKAKVNGELQIKKPKIKVGEAVEFSLTLVNAEKTDRELLVHYVIYFKKSNGTLSPKVFFFKKLKIKRSETVTLNKKHNLKLMTTRVLYTGGHKLAVRVNGETVCESGFELM